MASQREINAQADEILSQHGQAQAVRPASHELSAQEEQSYLSKTGESLKNAAGGAATIAQEAVSGAASLAQGAAAGAVNLAQGAASTVKNTLGVNSDSNNPSANSAAAANHPSGYNAAAAANHPGGYNAAAAAANHPSGNTAAAAAAAAAGANHPSNPSNRF
ncbi:uncharacterized transmembrane protein DDB_G0289901-like [Impatiens glandulifera]|uniref:uncharacterized transmembrane protein DDB_G0289901-like n=1 Tax=Impatiens glandulifera TaxID=253017 RepID=UPI001FB14CD0|nr:uncharacterized transmembrane protein DDB_G0289901-like [Impatiens glandulifera]